MKILQINTVFKTGSTGKIVASLNNTIEENGHHGYVAYGRDTGSGVCGNSFFKIGNRLDFVSHVLVNFFEGKSGFGSQKVTKRFLDWVDQISPDLIHLHNIHGFYINIEMLFDYIKEHNIPVVWTLHDCWSFTGQCAYFDYCNCDKWIDGCHNCPIYRREYPYSLFKDNSQWNYEQKKRIFTGVKNLTIVTPSEWLASLVRRSFLKEYEVKVINNGIDTDVFSLSVNKELDKKIILGVANIWDNRKGLKYLLELSELLDDTYQVVVIGVNKSQKRVIEKKYKKVIAITRTTNQKELASWYSKASVYVNPTLEDNFPTTNMEALACGTPVVTFDTGGSPEVLKEDYCGKVVEKDNINALLDAVVSVCNNIYDREKVRGYAMRFDASSTWNNYLSLYDNCMIK